MADGEVNRLGAVRLHHECGALAHGGGAAAPAQGPASCYVESAGVQAGELDPLAVEVMEEIGIELATMIPAASRISRTAVSTWSSPCRPKREDRAMD